MCCGRTGDGCGLEVTAVNEEEAGKNEEEERNDLEGGDEVLPLGSRVLVAHVQPGEEDDEEAGNDGDGHRRPPGKEGEVVGDGKAHDCDANRVASPPARPDEEHGHKWPSGLTEVDELPAVLGVCC